jgi:hypothetical protein
MLRPPAVRSEDRGQRDGAAFDAVRLRDNADIWEATPP